MELARLDNFMNEITNTINGEEKIATITFNSNGGSGEMATVSAIAGKETTLTSNKFTYENHGFWKWNTKKDGTGEYYDNNATIIPKDNITLFAQWANYGTKIEDNYTSIYTNSNPKENDLTGEAMEYYSGNCNGLLRSFFGKHSYFVEGRGIATGTNGLGENGYSYVVKKGFNTFTFADGIKDVWINLALGSGNTTNETMSQLKFGFDDNARVTILEGVNKRLHRAFGFIRK